jgi:hypothetical protein
MMTETPGFGGRDEAAAGAGSGESGSKFRGTLAPKTGKAAADTPNPAPTSGRLRGTLGAKVPADTSPDAPEVTSSGPYSEWAGQNQIAGAGADRYGNANGSQYDLIQDGSVIEAKVVVLNLYSGMNLSEPKAALERKGFTLIELRDCADLAARLANAAEFWLISDSHRHLTPGALDAIESFFHDGRGLYIWGDNAPYFADANLVLQRLFNVAMFGDTPGDQVVSMLANGKTSGLVPGHLVTTGLVNIYEGITIAEVPTTELLRPLVYGSNGRVVTAYFDHGGRRAIVDGGFTRLYNKWESAGTDRYIVNAATWLLNIERFGRGFLQGGRLDWMTTRGWIGHLPLPQTPGADVHGPPVAAGRAGAGRERRQFPPLRGGEHPGGSAPGAGDGVEPAVGRGRVAGADRLRAARPLAGPGDREAPGRVGVRHGAGLLAAHVRPAGAEDGPAGSRPGRGWGTTGWKSRWVQAGWRWCTGPGRNHGRTSRGRSCLAPPVRLALVRTASEDRNSAESRLLPRPEGQGGSRMLQ